MKKIVLILASAMLYTITAVSQESYFKQEAYILTIGEDRVTDTTQILDEELASISLNVLTVSKAGDVILKDDTICYLSGNRIEFKETIHPGTGKVVSGELESSGNAIVYSVDDDENPVEMYVRRREKGSERFSDPVLVRRHEYASPYGGFYSIISALNGRIIFWRESVIGTNKAFMTIDNTEEGTGEATVFTSLHQVQEQKFLSDDGRTFIFNVTDVNQPWESYYSYRDDRGSWSEPKELVFEGEPLKYVSAMNSNGNIIVSNRSVLEWNVNQYEIVREWSLDYSGYMDYQIADDGKTLYVVATNAPLSDSRVDDPPPVDFDLLQIRWKDDPKNPEITKLATAHELTYRLLDSGDRLMYNAFNYTDYLSKTDSWENY